MSDRQTDRLAQTHAQLVTGVNWIQRTSTSLGVFDCSCVGGQCSFQTLRISKQTLHWCYIGAIFCFDTALVSRPIS